MQKAFILTLGILLALASCSNGYKPKNDTEEVILAYIQNSLGLQQPVTELIVLDVDTTKRTLEEHTSRINALVPNTTDPIALLDSLKARQQELQKTADSILAPGADKITAEQYIAANEALQESSDIKLILIQLEDMVEDYRHILALPEELRTTIRVDVNFTVDGKTVDAIFTLNANGNKVVAYKDIRQ